MWRHSDEPPADLSAPRLLRAETRPVVRSARSARRRRMRVADGLCYVARRAGPQARRRRHELLLVSRAAAVRAALLEVAALVRCSPDPDPDCIAELHNLLTNGCDSPLYNCDVPADQLGATLTRAREVLVTARRMAMSPLRGEHEGRRRRAGMFAPRRHPRKLA
jgi:hypothetical protein